METLLNSKGILLPKSPYNLLQEIYIRDPWRILVCCMLLNQTKRKQVDGIREELFRRWPDALEMGSADLSELATLIKPLGFQNRRSRSLVKFSQDWTDRDWTSPRELHGIGQYALDSWEIFVEGKMKENPSDHILKNYVVWRRTIEKTHI